MGNITTSKKVNMLVVGSMVTLLFTLMLYVFMAQLLVDFVIGDLSTNLTLFLIIMGLLILTLLISIIVGFIILKDVKEATILKATIMSILSSILVLIILSYGSLLMLAPQTFAQVEWYEMMLIFPQVLIYFGIYILGNIFVLFIILIIIYYLFFSLFVEIFYEYKRPEYRRKILYRW